MAFIRKMVVNFPACGYSEILFTQAINQVNVTQAVPRSGGRSWGVGEASFLRMLKAISKNCIFGHKAHMLQNIERRNYLKL